MKTKAKIRTKAKNESVDNTKYYALDNGPLFITKVKEETKARGYKGLDGSISSNKRIPAGLIVEAIRSDGKVASQAEVMRDEILYWKN